MNKLVLYAFLLLSILTIAATAQDVAAAFTAAPVGDGPLFFFTHPEGERQDRIEIHGVVDPRVVDSKGQPMVHFFGRTKGSISIHERLERNRLLISQHGDAARLVVLDLVSGRVTELIADGRYTFHRRIADHVYFSDAEGLARRDISGEKPTERLVANEMMRVLELTERGILWLAKKSPAEILTADLDGKNARRVIELGLDLDFTFDLNASIAPSRQRVAIGASSLKGGHSLTLVDLASNQTKVLLDDVNIDVSALSSQTPSLCFTWICDDVVRFSETQTAWRDPTANDGDADGFYFVDLDVRSGERLAEKRYGPVGLHHTIPPLVIEPPLGKRWRIGAFDIEHDRLFRAAESDPIVDLTSNRAGIFPKITVDRQGRYAVYAESTAMDARQVVLVDAEKKTSTPIFAAWCYDLRWL